MVPWTTWQACLAKGISFLIWEVGAADKKEPTKHELSHNVKVRKNNLGCEIPISYATMITGPSVTEDFWESARRPSSRNNQKSSTVDAEGLTPSDQRRGVRMTPPSQKSHEPKEIPTAEVSFKGVPES